MLWVTEMIAAASTAPVKMQEQSITSAEIVLLIAGGVFTIALLLLFVFVLRKELKREKQGAMDRDSIGDDPYEDESGG